MHIAASVTAIGRSMIEKTKHMAETLVPGSRVVYGDTDSVMVIFKVPDEQRHDVHAHFEVATRVAAEISKTFKAPNELEHEKCYYPYLLFSKKRYAGMCVACALHVRCMCVACALHARGRWCLGSRLQKKSWRV